MQIHNVVIQKSLGLIMSRDNGHTRLMYSRMISAYMRELTIRLLLNEHSHLKLKFSVLIIDNVNAIVSLILRKVTVAIPNNPCSNESISL